MVGWWGLEKERVETLCLSNVADSQVRGGGFCTKILSLKPQVPTLIYCWWEGKLMQCMGAQSCSIFTTPGTVTCKAPLSMEFSRQECWSGLPFPTSEDLLVPRIKPKSLASHALAGGFFNHCTTWEINWCSH